MPPKPGTPRAPDHAGTWRKLKSGAWNVSGRFQGVPYSATAPTKKEAREGQRERIEAIRSGKVKERTKRDTLAGFLEHYLTRKKGRVEPLTYTTYRIAVDHLNEGFGDVQLSALYDAQVISDAYDALSARLAPATVRRAHMVLKQALRYAAEEGRNVPMIPKHIRPPKGETEPARAVPLSHLNAFLEAARADDPFWFAMWELARYSGLRLGELLALRWEDVTPTSVAVRRTLSEDAERRPRLKAYPKSAAGVRVVSVPREATAPLALLPRSGELIFGNRDGGPMLKTSASHAFQRAWTNAKLPGHAHVHLLRHTFAKSQFDQGVSLPRIAARMGHANGSITLKLYAHFERADDAEEPRAMVDYYVGAGATERPEMAENSAISGPTTKTTTNVARRSGQNKPKSR